MSAFAQSSNCIRHRSECQKSAPPCLGDVSGPKPTVTMRADAASQLSRSCHWRRPQHSGQADVAYVGL